MPERASEISAAIADVMRKMLPKLLTAGQIAAYVDLSRNAVIGQLARHPGLFPYTLSKRITEGGATKHRPIPSLVRVASAAPVKQEHKHVDKPRARLARKAALARLRPPEGASPLPNHAGWQQYSKRFESGFLGQEGRLSILDLPHGGGVCRFPIDTSKGTRYCGEPTLGKCAYCEQHARRVFSDVGLVTLAGKLA